MEHAQLNPLDLQLTEEETKQWHAGKLRFVDCEARCMRTDPRRVWNDGFRIIAHNKLVLRQSPPRDPVRVLASGAFDKVDPFTGAPLPER